jgi:hypothetical protein
MKRRKEEKRKEEKEERAENGLNNLNKTQETRYHSTAERSACNRRMMVRFRLSAFHFISLLFLFFPSRFSFVVSAFPQNTENHMNVDPCLQHISCHKAQQ